ARATLVQDGALWYLDVDGVDDRYVPASPFAMTDQWSHVGGWMSVMSSDRAFATRDVSGSSLRTASDGWGINDQGIGDIISGVDPKTPHFISINRVSDADASGWFNGVVNSSNIDPQDNPAGVDGLALFSRENDRWAAGFLGRFYCGAFIGGQNLIDIDRVAVEDGVDELTGVSLS
ncbi:MAG: hypothetical protein AAFW60_04260, partial [Pseudomonadota bacterium]